MLKLILSLLVVLTLAGWAGTATAGPITDIVTVDGKQWAQVDLFTNLSWDDINGVCPGGVCGSGTLNGYDMYGWSWASIDEMNNLFNYYFTSANYSPLLGPGPDVDATYGSGYANLFFADGWRPTIVDPIGVGTAGRMSDSSNYLGLMAGFDAIDLNQAATGFYNSDPDGVSSGAWFSRTDLPVTGVPLPATLSLIGLGLAVLGFSRRKHVTS